MKTGVVLLNWNAGDFTQACLESLFAAGRVPDRVVVVDNASHDGSADRLEAAWPQVEILRQAVNTGFAGGNNIGMRHLLAAGCNRLWILNNDTEVATNCLAVMETTLDAHPGIGVVTGKMLYPESAFGGRPTIWYAGGRVSRWTLEGDHPGQDQPDGPDFDQAHDTDFACGCSMLVRSEVLEAIGGYDNQFFALCEDVDWSLRARAGGHRIRYVPEAVLTHHVHASFKLNSFAGTTGRVTAASHYLLARNRRFLIRRHASGWFRVTSLTVYGLRQAWFWFGLTVRGRVEKKKAMRMGMRAGRLHPLQAAGGFEASEAYGMPSFD